MSEEMNATFTTEELLQQAQGNITGTLLATMKYLKEKKLSLNEFNEFLGDQFAPMWSNELSAKEFAYYQLRNHLTFGQEMYELSGDEFEAKIVLSVWPDEEMLTFFGISRDEADAMWKVAEVIAEHVGFDCTYTREGDKLTVTISRPSEE